MINSIEHWSAQDPFIGIPLEQIPISSSKALSLVLRNKNNISLKEGFYNVTGAIEIMAGFEYHHNNIVCLAEALAQGSILDDTCVNHEAVAYISRVGQFYAFATSKFVKDKIGSNIFEIIPTIKKFIIFRNKYAAHRSIDQPRSEDSEELQVSHAFSMTRLYGRMFVPKPGGELPIKYSAEIDISQLRRNLWKNNYASFQIFDGESNSHIDLIVDKEHPSILSEAYSLIEKVVMTT